MKITVLTFTCALLAMASVSARAAETFRSEELKFEVIFPATPQQKTATQNVASVQAKVFRFKSTSKTLSPAMSVIVYARAPFTKQEAATGLEMSGARQAERFKGQIVSRKDLTVNGIAGKETVIEGVFQGRKFFYRAQTFYAGNRQYILSVVDGTMEAVSAPADGYFASFKLWE